MDSLIGTLNSGKPSLAIVITSSSAAKGQDNIQSVKDFQYNPKVQREQMDLEHSKIPNKAPHIPRNTNLPGSNWVAVTKKKGYPVILPIKALGDTSLDDKNLQHTGFFFLLISVISTKFQTLYYNL